MRLYSVRKLFKFYIPVLRRSPSFNQWLNILYSYDLVICLELLKIVCKIRGKLEFYLIDRLDQRLKVRSWHLEHNHESQARDASVQNVF